MTNDINTRDLAIMTEQGYYMVAGEFEECTLDYECKC